MNAQLFPVVILAGGLATRLKPLTETIPKALVDVNGEPFIAHQLRLLHTCGIERVIICVGHLGEMIRQYTGDGSQFGVRVEFVFDGPRLLGTAGAIKQALPVIRENFFVLYGDSYLPCDYCAIQESFVTGGKLALMTICHNQNQWDSSNVEYVNGRVLNYDKHNRTPRMHYIDYGLGVFAHAAFDYVPAQQPYDLAVLYQQLLQADELAGYEVSQRFYEIGSLTGLEETRRYVAEQAVLKGSGEA